MAEINWNADDFIQKTKGTARQRLLQRGFQIQRAAVALVEEVVYSTPPSPHYKRTQKMAHINVVDSSDDTTLRVKVGSETRYAKFNELGTFKMAARPFMRPAFEAVKQDVQDKGL